MNLVMIKDESCPTCKSITVRESSRGSHSFGEPFEEREFKCGCVVAWIPNFSALRIKTECPENETVKLQKLKRQQFKSSIQNLIASSDVDQDLKNRMLSHLSWL